MSQDAVRAECVNYKSFLQCLQACSGQFQLGRMALRLAKAIDALPMIILHHH